MTTGTMWLGGKGVVANWPLAANPLQTIRRDSVCSVAVELHLRHASGMHDCETGSAESFHNLGQDSIALVLQAEVVLFPCQQTNKFG